MNEIEKQILENQKVIMLALHQINNYESTQEGLNKEWENTDKLLYPKVEKEINDYHRKLFGNKWKDIKHTKTKFTLIERIKNIFVLGEKDE